MMIQLRPYQRAAIAAIYAYFMTACGHPLVIIPTAGGKSLVAAAFIQEVLAQWPDERIIILTHVRELISQNFAELLRLWPEAPAGIYSAGLNRRDVQAQILFAGIQSVHRKAYAIQRADLVLVDEAHLIPRQANTTYRRFLGDLTRINPQLKIIGLTATPYRLDSGMLHTGPDALFDDIAFEVSVRELIDQGYLAPLISKQTSTQLDVSGVGTRGGEFIAGQLEAAVDQDPITRAAIDEVVAYGRDRRSWLLFCAGVGHARHVCGAVRERGFSCATIFGHTPKADRDRIIAAFKRREVRALASMGVLTTGFNAPAVDLIAMLRPTKSTGLYVQMAGRGTRLASGKDNCLVLDFAGNVARHGPIDLVKPRDKLSGEGDGEAPTKVCPECQTINALAARVCIECDYVFPAPEVQLEATATTRPILSVGRPEWVNVGAVTYHRHEKPGRPPSLRIDYHCGLVRHSEWVCPEHGGYAASKATQWWRRRANGLPPPTTVDEALSRAQELRRPVQIAVRPNGRYTEVVHARFA
jgi:DNA repair protein RadD